MGEALRKDNGSSTSHQFNAANDNKPPKPKLVVGNTTKVETGAQYHSGKGISHIASRRAEQNNTEDILDREEDISRQKNTQRMRNALQYRNALRGASKHNGKAGIETAKVFIRGIETLGAVLFPMVFQMIFGILAVASLAVEETWWGWVVPGIYMAGVCWLISLLIGTYTMFISGSIMSPYFKNWKVLIAFFFCFSANWAPILQIFPWAAAWILIVILQKK